MGDHYRSSTGDLARSERWDRDRFVFERDRDERVRFEEKDRYYRRDSGPRAPPAHYRETSVDTRLERRRFDDDDYVVRDRRSYYDDEPRSARLPRRPSPPGASEYDRRVVIEKERVRSPSPGPRQRPGGLLRRQSSLDTFDRQPRFFSRREEYGPPARREDFRPPPNVPIPLPRERGLPPPRRYDDREYYEEIRVSEPDHYGDEDFRPVPERIREREKEVIRSRRRAHSRESRSTRRSHHGASTIRSSSRSSSTTSSSSSSSATTTVTVKSEYPKKGKTRIPARLVSERALIDLGYPFIKEGNTIVVQKALGQENIDDLLKLSEDYKKSDEELITGRSQAPREVIEERREEFFMTPAVQPPPPPPPVMHAPPPAPPTVVYAQPPPPPPPAPVEIVDKTTVIRDVSPARSYTTTTTSTSRTPVIVDTRERVEVSEAVPVGPLALVTADSHRRHRSHSRGSRDIRSEISHLERELARRERRHGGGELVTAERLSNGELVLYEEQVVKVEEPRKGVRIEKDKKGRMSISVPKYR